MNTRIGQLVGAALMAVGLGALLDDHRRRETERRRDRRREQREARREARVPSEATSDDDGILTSVDRAQKRWTPVGFVYAVMKKYGEDGGGRLAAVVAYYGFFSVFPALLALTGVVGWVLADQPGLRADIVDSAVGQFPVIGESIADQSLGKNGLALIVGLAGAVWAGLGAMLAAQHAMNEVWEVPQHERPNAVKARIRGLIMLVVFGVGLVGGTVLANLVAQLSIPGIAKVGIVVANLAVNVGIAWLAFQILTEKHLAWRSLLPGAAVAGVAYYILQNLGSILVDRYVANASDTYGAFAVVIGLLTWFHLLSQVTLIAAEVDVVRARKLYPRTLFGDDLTEADERAFLAFQESAARHEEFEPPNPDAVCEAERARAEVAA